jgi:diguanylate cyclase (GGDEF)-like protein
MKNMSKVLVIDDNQQILDIASQCLESMGYEVVIAERGELGIEMAHAHNPDLILCDIMMPDMDGYAVLENLRKSDAPIHTVPFIFLTGLAERKHIRQGMTLGADDYLTKPFRFDELIEAVQVRIARRKQITEKYEEELKRADEKLDYVQNYDSITNLPNRNLLKEHFLSVTQQSDLLGLRVAVLSIAIDGFQDLFEQHGNAFANAVLKATSHRLKSTEKGDVRTFYLNTNEYALIYPLTPHDENLQRIGYQVLSAVGEPLRILSRELNLTASVGLALYPEDSDNIEKLLQHATRARREAADQGGNQFRMAT